MTGAVNGWEQRRVTSGSRPADVGVTAYVRDSGVDGPHVLILGGVHGDEIGGVVAAGALTTQELNLTAGRVTVVPVAHEAAHAAFARTGPADDGNLARSFPGDRNGTPTQRLAALIDEHLISRADVLVDLHTSSQDIDMPFFAGGLDDGTDYGTRGVELAIAFGAGIVWTHPHVSTGRTLTSAMMRSIPAIYVESPRGGVLDPTLVAAYLTGLQRVMLKLGLVTANMPGPPAPSLWLHGDGNTDSFTAAEVDGFFISDVAMLHAVTAGQGVGRVVDHRGRTLADIVAPGEGVVSTLRTRAPVTVGTPVVGITPVRPSILQLPSDVLVRRERKQE